MLRKCKKRNTATLKENNCSCWPENDWFWYIFNIFVKNNSNSSRVIFRSFNIFIWSRNFRVGGKSTRIPGLEIFHFPIVWYLISDAGQFLEKARLNLSTHTTHSPTHIHINTLSHKHRHPHTHPHTLKHSNTQTDTHIHTHTHTHTNTHTHTETVSFWVEWWKLGTGSQPCTVSYKSSTGYTGRSILQEISSSNKVSGRKWMGHNFFRFLDELDSDVNWICDLMVYGVKWGLLSHQENNECLTLENIGIYIEAWSMNSNFLWNMNRSSL